MAGALDLPLVDAEALKRRLGEASPQVQSAESAVQPAITELVGEIRNSVQYFATLPGRVPIARVLLTGGGARLRGLVKELRSQVRIPVEHVSPLARLDLSRIDLDPEQAASIDPVLATPIGLALPEPNPSVKKFNLVPPEVTQRAFERSVARKTFVAAGVVGLLLVAGSALPLPAGPRRRERCQQPEEQRRASSTPQIPTFDKVVAITNELRTAKGEVSQISSKAVDWSAVIAQLQQRVPSGLNVTTFSGTSAGGDRRPCCRGDIGDGECGHFQRNGARRCHRFAHPGGLRGIPELGTLRSRGAVDRQSDGLFHVQPARCGLGHQCQCAHRRQHNRRLPVHLVAHGRLQLDQERRFMMEQITRYRIPILTAVGALILAIVVYAAWISPEGGKLSSLHAQQTQLQSQQTHLQAELSTLQRRQGPPGRQLPGADHGSHRDARHARPWTPSSTRSRPWPWRRVTPTRRASA